MHFETPWWGFGFQKDDYCSFGPPVHLTAKCYTIIETKTYRSYCNHFFLHQSKVTEQSWPMAKMCCVVFMLNLTVLYAIMVWMLCYDWIAGLCAWIGNFCHDNGLCCRGVGQSVVIFNSICDYNVHICKWKENLCSIVYSIYFSLQKAELSGEALLKLFNYYIDCMLVYQIPAQTCFFAKVVDFILRKYFLHFQ